VILFLVVLHWPEMKMKRGGTTGISGVRLMLLVTLGSCTEFVVLQFRGDHPRWPRFGHRLNKPKGS
jgi:hypothetical protein